MRSINKRNEDFLGNNKLGRESPEFLPTHISVAKSKSWSSAPILALLSDETQEEKAPCVIT